MQGLLQQRQKIDTTPDEDASRKVGYIEVAVQGLLERRRKIGTTPEDDANRDQMTHSTSLNSLSAHFAKWTLSAARGKAARDKTHRFILVLELGDRVLSSALLHDNISGENMLVVRNIMKDLAGALNHMHEKGRIHGDMKPLNAVARKGQWVPIDLDVACTIGEPFGTKIPSSGYCPPEMAAVMLKASDAIDKVEPKPEMLSEYRADVAYDLWSLGSIFFHLIIGTPLWETFYGDGISHCDHLKLVLWRKSHLKNRLQETGVTSNQKGEMGAAYDLLCKLLEPVHLALQISACTALGLTHHCTLHCAAVMHMAGSRCAKETL